MATNTPHYESSRGSRNRRGSRRGYNSGGRGSHRTSSSDRGSHRTPSSDRGSHRTPSSDRGSHRTPSSDRSSQMDASSIVSHTHTPGRGYGRGTRGIRGRGRGFHERIPHHECVVKERDKNQLHFYRLDISEVIKISKANPDDIVLFLEDKLKGFQQSLSSCQSIKGNSRRKYVEAVIEILKKLCHSEMTETANTIFAEFLSCRCAQFHSLLSEFIKVMLPLSPDICVVKDVCFIFTEMLFRLRSISWNVLPIDDLSDFVSITMVFPQETQSKVQALKVMRNEIREEVHRKLQQPKHDSLEEFDNSQYRAIPILPTIEEVCSATPPRLRSSIINGAYTCWEHYYDIQFRLLREDFVAPLRRGISEFKSPDRDKRLTDVYIYKNVRLTKPLFTKEGICFLMQFDTSRLKQRKSWEHSKRLIFGSLLCFSPVSDKFEEDVFFATVVNRDSEKLAIGQVEVQFADSIEILPHMCTTYFTVVESKAYFEASRHILHSLQTAEVDTMPFSKYLVLNDSNTVQKPAYLKDDNASFDLHWLYPSSCSHHSIKASVNILNDWEWPLESMLELDESQLKAIKMALTKEISVIQGPPGTGKTYIGYKIVQTLLQNRNVWDPDHASPILVMCLTNHALDQFLEGILQNKVHRRGTRQILSKVPNIVRVGNRSQSQEIQEFNLRNVRKRIVPHHMLSESHDIHDNIKDIGSDITQYYAESQQIIQSLHSSNVITSGLKKLREVIDPKHYYDLIQIGAKNELWQYSLEIWLGLWNCREVIVTPKISIDNASEILKENENDSVTESDGLIGTQNQNVSDLSNDDTESYSGESTTDELIDIEGEAEIEESSRKIDDDAFRHLDINQKNEEPLKDALTTHISQHSSDSAEVQDAKVISREYTRKSGYEKSIILKNAEKIPVMDKDELETIENICELPIEKRWALFKLWIQMYQEWLISNIREKTIIFDQECRKYTQCQQNLDRYALEKAEVIGMTTTGAAKYQHIIHLVKPKIVIVEEAAEVLESHIVSALNAGTQHLILIGDHKQLRPKLNEYELAKKHHLDISLFERLIRNGLSHATLLIQHRMRPQIARLVCPHVYGKLINHESVQAYDSDNINVKGFDKNMFFFQHYGEEKEDPLLLSQSNEYEAQFVVSLCRHLLQQGYQHSQITILTAYTGQLLKVRHKMPKKDFAGVKVTNIDNFQGEENDIIILSLVRNNSMGNVGFLREENRVCVALSRAKIGLYCFGNFEMLRKKVPLWDAILSDVERDGCLGTELHVFCQNHKDKKFLIKKPEDFAASMPIGGCMERCTFRLECGHQCSLTCHVLDSSHVEYTCKKPCKKLCIAGLHQCKAQCYKNCPPCHEMVIKDMPRCGHKQAMKCSDNPVHFNCHTPCLKLCSNGFHECSRECYQCFTRGCIPCRVKVTKEMPKCGHKQIMDCHIDPSEELCHNRCSKSCPEGHPCQKLCSEPCGKCFIVVERIMPVCDHKQKMECFIKPSEHNCRRKCKKYYDCGHFCPKKCHEPCDINCTVEVKKKLPQCGHEQTMPCYFSPASFHCTNVCEKLLSCHHACQQECGSECDVTKCTEMVQHKLPCGHTARIMCKDKFISNICNEICRKKLPCGHECRKKCSEPCIEKCCVRISVTCAKGTHNIKVFCYERTLGLEASKNKCMSICGQQLACKHPCQRKCYEDCECNEKIKKACKCGHTHSVKCGDDSNNCMCMKECEFVLKCGHKCSGKCGHCFTSRIHYPCVYDVQVKRFCGHESRLPCFGLEDHCPKKCQFVCCAHISKKCDHACWEECEISCSKECFNQCPHIKCKLACSEVCEVPPCGKPCTRKLPCGHYCPGLCGEKCVTTACMTCNRKKFIDKGGLSKGKKFKPQDHHYIQLECGHFFTVDALDKKIGLKGTGGTQMVFPPLCPTCRMPVANTLRYRQLWLRNQQDNLGIKSHVMPDSVYDREESSLICVQAEQILNSCRSQLNSHERYSSRNKEFPKLFNSLVHTRPEAINQETLCAFKLLLCAHNLERKVPHDLDSTVKNLVLVFAGALVFGKGKLSIQIVVDIHSELFRISLLALIHDIDKSCLGIQDLKRVGTVSKYLEQMEQDSSYRLTHAKYEECLQYLHIQQDGIPEPEYQSVVVQPVELPPITKGEWYKCVAGHIYFMEANYSATRKVPTCQQCTGKESLVSVQRSIIQNPSPKYKSALDKASNKEGTLEEATDESNCTLM